MASLGETNKVWSQESRAGVGQTRAAILYVCVCMCVRIFYKELLTNKNNCWGLSACLSVWVGESHLAVRGILERTLAFPISWKPLGVLSRRGTRSDVTFK